MSNNVLKVEKLTKSFGAFNAVCKLSFSLDDGEILGLLGPNGAGKTTTIQMLLGVMEPTSGIIDYFGKSIYEYREEILKQINFSSTYISMPWLFTSLEILDVYARLYEIPDKNKRINKLLKEFDMDHLKKKQFSMLSAGERTRLLLVKSFLNYPRIILLDEPTASLDVDIAVKVRDFLKKEKNEYNVSMLFTSHNMSEVEEMCDRVIILSHGKIIDEDTPENLAKKITDCVLELVIRKDSQKAEKFLSKIEIPYEKKRFDFKITTDEKGIAEFLMLLASNNIRYEEINVNKPDLEDYFLQVTGKEMEND